MMAIDPPLLSALFAAFAIALYVMLDGFDLGVGALLLTQSDEQLRDRMVDSILPTWDGNETWLIMGGVALLAAFPMAYGILLPAFYLPLIIMLLALGLRGVSFEFRFQAIGARRVWDLAFGLGSIVAALMQGLIVGGLIQGVTVSGESFDGSVFDIFQPFPALIAITVLAGYTVLGAGWLHLKTTRKLRTFAERGLHLAVSCFAVLAAATCAAAVFVQPGVRSAWTAHPFILGAISVLFLATIVALLRAVGGCRDGRPFALGLMLFGLGLAGLGIAIFPDVVPFRLTLWAAASTTLSQLFLLIGAVIVTPVVLAYSAFAYRVFRGKTPESGWDA
jgi:cytochrome bd ubiquinol oxidase subunit II